MHKATILFQQLRAASKCFYGATYALERTKNGEVSHLKSQV